jgi:hypothetical protein
MRRVLMVAAMALGLLVLSASPALAQTDDGGTGVATAALTAFLIAALPVAVSVTKGTDLVRNLVDPTGTRLPKVLWNIVPFILGVGFCVGWNFNLFEPLVQAVPSLKDSGLGGGTFGEVATGLAVGGMASFWHEKLDDWSSRAKANRAAVGGR